MPERVQNTERVRNLTEDALFCSLFTILALVMTPALGIAGDFIGMAMTAVFACLNQSKGHLRVLCISMVLLALLGLFSSVHQMLSIYVWRISAGVLVSRFLRKRGILRACCACLVLLGLQLAKTAFTITVLTPMTVSAYVSGFAEQLRQLPGVSAAIPVTAPAVLLYMMGSAVLQCLVIYRLNALYQTFVLRRKNEAGKPRCSD